VSAPAAVMPRIGRLRRHRVESVRARPRRQSALRRRSPRGSQQAPCLRGQRTRSPPRRASTVPLATESTTLGTGSVPPVVVGSRLLGERGTWLRVRLGRQWGEPARFPRRGQAGGSQVAPGFPGGLGRGRHNQGRCEQRRHHHGCGRPGSSDSQSCERGARELLHQRIVTARAVLGLVTRTLVEGVRIPRSKLRQAQVRPMSGRLTPRRCPFRTQGRTPVPRAA
jgi:hypothetical protein